jgi:mRNA-degrading endonuclease toxin of MazEF toxin-antitoxin module
MNRGDIWLVNIGGRVGKRPAVILTRQNVLPYLNKVTVAEVTSKGKGYPTEVFIGQKANLPRPSFVEADNIQTVPKSMLVKHVGTLDRDTMMEISRRVVLSLGLESALD